MSLLVYLASDRPLRVIEWHEPPRPLYVVEIADGPDENSLPASLTLPCRYYAGSHEGCGCGFCVGENLTGEEDDDADREYLRAARESRQALASHIREALDAGATVELHAFWTGEGFKEPAHRASGTPDTDSGSCSRRAAGHGNPWKFQPRLVIPLPHDPESV